MPYADLLVKTTALVKSQRFPMGKHTNSMGTLFVFLTSNFSISLSGSTEPRTDFDYQERPLRKQYHYL